MAFSGRILDVFELRLEYSTPHTGETAPPRADQSTMTPLSDGGPSTKSCLKGHPIQPEGAILVDLPFTKDLGAQLHNAKLHGGCPDDTP